MEPPRIQRSRRQGIRKLFVQAVCIATITLFSVACSERQAEIKPIGVWENTTHWDNNAITLKVRPDSVMLFKAEKMYCPGTKFFVAAGKWHIEQDSFLVMDPFTDGRTLELQEYFPELMQSHKDSANVIVLSVNAKLIIRDSLIYDMSPEGKAVRERTYRKTAEQAMPH